MLKIKYTKEEPNLHFVVAQSDLLKEVKLFKADTKKEVKKKLLNWVWENLPGVAIWKIKI